MLEINPGLEAKTHIRGFSAPEYPGRYADGQLRSITTAILKIGGHAEGPVKEVFFPQLHHPGQLGQSDFTNMNKLGITIGGMPI